MKIQRVVLFFYLLFISSSTLVAEEDKRPLFFSLGSNCEIASILGHFNLRHAAGPLDWVLSLDYHLFLKLLENDFEGFIDARYLKQYPDTHVINSLYSIDFRHDWPDLNFEQHLPEVQSRLQRRVDRILALKNYAGKVYFVRGAFDTNINPYLPTITKECTRITPKDAKKIRNVLSRKYPNLNFTLIIINYEEELARNFNKNLDRIMEFKVKKLDRQKREQDYKRIMEYLILKTTTEIE